MNDNKLITLFSASMMAIIGAAAILYLVQQLLPQQQQVQPTGYGTWYLGPAGLIMNVENGVDEEPEYFGEATPGTLDSEPGWRIYKYDYVRDPVSGDIVSGTLRYANGNVSFDKVWDDRADYVYS